MKRGLDWANDPSDSWACWHQTSWVWSSIS